MLSGLWALCDLWSINSTSQMKWLVIVSSDCQTVSPPSFVWEILKGSAGGGTLNPPWLRTPLYGGIPHLTPSPERKESGFRGKFTEVFFQQNISEIPEIFPLFLLSPMFLSLHLCCIPFILRPSSLVPRSYQNCVSQILSLYWVKLKIKIKTLELEEIALMKIQWTTHLKHGLNQSLSTIRLV